MPLLIKHFRLILSLLHYLSVVFVSFAQQNFLPNVYYQKCLNLQRIIKPLEGVYYENNKQCCHL